MLRVVMDEATYIMVVLQDMRKGGCICLQKGGGGLIREWHISGSSKEDSQSTKGRILIRDDIRKGQRTSTINSHRRYSLPTRQSKPGDGMGFVTHACMHAYPSYRSQDRRALALVIEIHGAERPNAH